jgi:Amt family ammonium transporter
MSHCDRRRLPETGTAPTNADVEQIHFSWLLTLRWGAKEPMPPHGLPLCLINTGLLCTGWFGFNAGSALSASPLAALAFLIDLP